MVRSITVGGIKFEAWPVDLNSSFLIGPEGVSGWDSVPDVRRDDTPIPAEHGSFDAPGYLGSRVIEWPGHILASSEAECLTMRRRLAAVLGGKSGRIDVEDEDGVMWTRVRLGALRITPLTGGLEAEYQAQFWAPDPFRFGKLNEFSSGTLYHYGTAPAEVELIVTGSGTYSINGGQAFSVSSAISGGQTDVVSIKDGTVHRNGVLLSGAVSSPGYFNVPPGVEVPLSVTGSVSVVAHVYDTYT